MTFENDQQVENKIVNKPLSEAYKKGDIFHKE